MGCALNKAEKKFTFKIYKLHRSFQNIERKKCPQSSTELRCVLVFLNEACVGVGVVFVLPEPSPQTPHLVTAVQRGPALRAVSLAALSSPPATAYC